MTISIKPTASGSTIEQDGSTILTVDGSGNITPSNDLYPKVPSFSARMSATQNVTNSTWTKVQFDTKMWDTDSDFDTTNYKFTPSIAGYYHINGMLRVSGSGNCRAVGTKIYKNGADYTNGVFIFISSLQNTALRSVFSEVVYLNGTTDYIEIYGFTNAGGTIRFDANTTEPKFQAHLVSV
jgi:hypothetical protein